MIHEMKLNSAPFELIKAGKKDIEMRLFDEKRSKLCIGDTIVFTNLYNGEQLETRVLNLYRYKNFEELYNEFSKERLGYSAEELALASDMQKFYSESDIEKFGVLSIQLLII